MDTIRLGKTDLTVTRIGFGGIPIQRLSEKDAISVVRRCVDLGINFLDTANAYSNSEERIGKAISGRYEGLIIATKSGARNPDRIKEHLEQSLKMLQVDSIDLYQLHAINDFDAYNQVMNERLDTMEEAKRVGKIKHIGITSHNIDVAKEAVKSNRFETLMFPFNFITSEPEDQLLPLCKKHDVGFIAMKPMGGGMLEDATIAFKYLLQFPDVVPIPGIEHLNEIDEIVEVVNGPRNMTEAEIARMQQLKDELGTQFCRRCDYCRPCSVDIPISTVMVTPSFFKRLPPERIFSSWIGNLL
ncbi:MAG: aldo/keto reductase, partial [Thermodesulfobacteriota bacterium]|nr:aldo/keto reductase [Thermodesulfobacteriota bacterium]